MKSSGKGGNRRGQARECVIVDGYNVLAQMRGLRLDQLEDIDAARDALLGDLQEYRAYFGRDVVLVFDAHRARQRGTDSVCAGVRLIYTANQETADERIERLVYELRDVYPQLTVVTSDAVEQQVAFGGGALRISSREFLRQLDDMRRGIRQTVAEETGHAPGRVIDAIRHDIANILEKWRRE
jgi:predicted RNA-binding protein with PIN domain